MSACYPDLKAVIFDCDGILVDSEPLHYQAFQAVLQPLGLSHDYDRYVERYIGFDDRDAFVEIFRDSGRPLKGADLNGLIEAKESALQQIVAKGISTFPGVIPLVRELVAHKVPLAVASGSFRHEVESFIEALGLRGAFPIIVAADDVSHSKPDPETYLAALERLRTSLGLSDLEPRACVAIEDTPAGIQSAKGAGLYVIGVAHSFPVDQLNEADHVLEALAKLNFETLTKVLGSSTGSSC